MKTAYRTPAVRVDGGKRIDLKEKRARRKAQRAASADRPPIEDTRVADAWRREEARVAAWKRLSAEERRIQRLAVMGGGKEGAKTAVVKVRLSGERTDRMAIRSKPGTFEWRYGRNKQDALFHAGNHLAILWERAGMTIASSANFLRGTTSGYSTGLADGRAQALDKLDGFRDTMGHKPAERLIDYCVLGLTTAEIARKDGSKERDMAPVLHQHLRDCAVHFNLIGGNGV